MMNLFRGRSSGENPWFIHRTSPILIKTRARPGTNVKEIWAEGDLRAAPSDIQRTLYDLERFTQFMPYITEAHEVGTREPDGSRYTYSRLDLPVLSPRDFVHRVYVDRDAGTDPSGVFASHWFSVPTKIPERRSVVRLQISEGSWLVTPLPGGESSHVIYCICADPAGSLPAFAINRANASGISDTFDNIEREARKRRGPA